MLSVEHKRKISLGMMGHKIPLEVRLKIANSRKGKKHSFETIRKIKASMPKGENAYNWKGGKEKERKGIRDTREYKDFRRSVFQRDDFTCQMIGCHKKGGELNCHHIEKFSLNEKDRINVNNGITLCVKCHRKIKGKESEFESLFSGIICTKKAIEK